MSGIPAHWFQILLSLADRNLHGLAITQDVYERTDGDMHLWPGMLYGALKRMVAEGLVEEIEAPTNFVSGGGRPRFYRITSSGRRCCITEVRRMARNVAAARTKRLIGRRA
jgi:DNA-binding PadR family transcriptional regulator